MCMNQNRRQEMEKVSDQEIIKQAQKDLLEKREKFQKQQENTLASVKSLLADGNIDKARDEGLALKDTRLWDTVVNLFREHVKPGKCGECGDAELSVYVSPINLNIMRGEICGSCKKSHEEEKKRKYFISARDYFLEHIDEKLLAYGVPKRFLSATPIDFPEHDIQINW